MLAREGTHGPVIHDVNSAAQALGMKAGARVTDMRALVPALQVEDAAPDADAADLAMLAHWSRRWCPWTQGEGVAGLLLDTTGSDHLHGGERAMMRDMARAFAAAGLGARISIAPTIGTAWALSRYGAQRRIVCPDCKAPELLRALPVAALRLNPATVLLLGRLGLKTIGALMDVPRESLVRRFRRIEAPDANPVLRLDQALGRLAEPLVSEHAQRPVRAIRRFAEPLGDLAGLSQVLADLSADLCALMDEAHVGARGLRLTVYRVDGSTMTVEARASRASRNADHLAGLFAGKLEKLDPGFGVDAAALEATDGEGLGAEQDDLGGERRDDMAFTRLIDRLAARLGDRSVLKPVSRGSHIPEHGENLVPAADAVAADSRAVQREMATPLRLLPRPEEAEVIHAVPDGPPARFRWRRQVHDIARSQGPERIAPEWWREKSTVRLRDYYHVEDSEGRRFWLYREGLIADGRGRNPRWFVQGLDA